MITWTLEQITPAIAKAWLMRNDVNRNIRPSKVRLYAKIMRDGYWRPTHQCIAFDASDRLIDGQHRLTSIVETGVTVWMYVARYDRDLKPMEMPFDTGANRSFVDQTGVRKYDKETAAILCRIKDSAAYNSGAFPTTYNDLEEAIEIGGQVMYDINSMANTKKAKGTGAAGSRLAVFLRVVSDSGHAEYYLGQYTALCSLDYENLTPRTQQFLRSMTNNMRKTDQVENVIQAYSAMSYNKRMQSKNIIGSYDLVFAALKEIVTGLYAKHRKGGES